MLATLRSFSPENLNNGVVVNDHADASESDGLKSKSDSDTAGSNSPLLNTKSARRSSKTESKHFMSKQVTYIVLMQ